MDNFKFNFLSRGQLGSLSVDNFFSLNSKCYHAMSIFFGDFIFALIARTFSGNRLIFSSVQNYVYPIESNVSRPA